MEIVLAFVVTSAVIIFGALVSVGNERQRKAIDTLREQIEQWAIQDLRIKLESINYEERISDPTIWLSKTVERFGIKSNLKFVEYFQYPQTLVCETGDNTHRIIFSPSSPTEIRRIRKNRQNHLANYAITNPLLSLRPSDKKFEINILNAGIFFSQELSIVWRLLTGEKLSGTNKIWIYQCGEQ